MATMTQQQALNLAMEHHQAGRFSDAEAIYRQLFAIFPHNADLRHLLGVVAHHSGRMEEGRMLIQQAIAQNPRAFEYRNNHGLLLTDLLRFDEAIVEFENAIKLEPGRVEGHYNLGITLGKAGRPADSVAAYQAALRVGPHHAMARLNLGTALATADRMDEAIAHYRSVLREEPANAPVAVNLGSLLKDLARLDEAIALYRTGLSIAPNDPEAHSNLGVALKDSGDIRAALDSFRRAVELAPHRAEIRSNLIYSCYMDPDLPAIEIVEEHRRWNRAHAAPLRSEWRPHPNDRSPERPLRIGYVSPDLRDHVVGHTLLPAYEAHDRGPFELFCYSGAFPADAVTARFRSVSAHWRETANLSDAQVAAQIREDRVDILVDLSLHTAFNRLLTFARKPAPVQVSWLGYPGGNGLEAMDYRITDPYLDPPAQAVADGFEEPLRLPHAWCCYRPPAGSPEASELPCERNRIVTFGSFNNFAKINQRVLAVWAEILASVPGSRLLMVLKGSQKEQIVRFFAERGIGADRVEFLAYYPAAAGVKGGTAPPAYLERYHRIDIALDPFPYNGMTTTFDALWMGVPVIALIGTMTLGRASWSLLSNVGLPELAARSEQDYVRIAAELAADLPRLEGLRATLRQRLQTSPLLDATGFTRHLEAAWRTIWRRWCAAAPAAQP